MGLADKLAAHKAAQGQAPAGNVGLAAKLAAHKAKFAPQVDDTEFSAGGEATNPSKVAFGNVVNEAIDRMTPVGSVKEIAGQLSGERPNSGLRAGLAGADLASLGLASELKAGGEAAKMGIQGVLQHLAANAGGGAAGIGAEKAGAPWWGQALASIIGGAGAGRMAGPTQSSLKPVSQGQEPQALARAAQQMGLPVEAPLSSKPRDVVAAFQNAKGVSGANVGAAKEAALQTAADAPEVIGRSLRGINKGLEKAGVPIGEGGFQPEFSVDPAGANLLREQAARVGSIPKDIDANEAMKLSNNVLEATKKILAESKRTGTGMAGRTANMAVQEWQSAIDSLGPADKVAAAKIADSAFSKLSALTKMTEKASGTKTGISPSFSPREFVYAWENMPANVRSRFDSSETQLLDAMLTQKPGLMQKAIQGAIEFAKSKGIKGISFHPTARFYENSPDVIGPRAATFGAQEGVSSITEAQRREEAAKRARRLAGAR